MKKIVLFLSVATLALASLTACDETGQNSFTDARDGKKYRIVKIGEQTWMAENLNFNAEGSLCFVDESENCDKYGRLYLWETAKKACPVDWHLPSDAEWQTLVVFAGGNEVAGIKLKAKNGWDNSGNGTDDYGFSVLPGGNAEEDGGFAGGGGYLWSASKSVDANAYARAMTHDYSGVYRNDFSIASFFSIRCIQDNKN